MSGETSGPFHANLLLDTDRSAARLGIRSAATAQRQLVFRHAGREIDVLHQPAGDVATVLWGQVVTVGGEPCAGAQITLEGAGGGVDATTTADRFGEFRILVSDAPPTALLVRVDGDVIRCAFDAAPCAALPAACSSLSAAAGDGDRA